MNSKNVTLLFAVVLIVAFFLDFWAGFSGLDMVKAEGGDWKKYIVALLPLSGLMLLIGALQNGKYPVGRSLWTWLPLLTILYMLILGPVIDGADFSTVLKSLGKGYGIGLWLSIVTSVLLAFYNPKN